MKKFECATPSCRNTQRFGDLCASCATKQRHQQTPKAIRTTVYPTGETRRSDGLDQAEYTDGRQRWWASATGVAA